MLGGASMRLSALLACPDVAPAWQTNEDQSPLNHGTVTNGDTVGCGAPEE